MFVKTAYNIQYFCFYVHSNSTMYTQAKDWNLFLIKSLFL